jgi:hypothetical protein
MHDRAVERHELGGVPLGAIASITSFFENLAQGALVGRGFEKTFNRIMNVPACFFGPCPRSSIP